MLVIKVWGLPDEDEERFCAIHTRIVNAVVSEEIPSLQSEKDMFVWFPKDRMSYGLGEQILVELSCSHPLPNKGIESLAGKVGPVLALFFPGAEIICHFANNPYNLWLSSEYVLNDTPK